MWSGDSDVLAIETVNKSTQLSRIYLFTICNYHWYLKQSLEFGQQVQWFQWDSRFLAGKTLHILLKDQTYTTYK